MNRIGFLIAICLLVFQCSVASALLPPLFSGRDELKALVNDKQFTEKFDSGDAIIAIYRIKTGFIVLTNKHKMFVDIVQDKSAKPGPAQFRLVFHDPVTRKHAGKLGKHFKIERKQESVRSSTTPSNESK
ncbi:MAG: hypothetical protein LLG04_01430 [Parachlamydia sp.]|nr:hypothetical protein [Parachlamydia sp.]